MTKKIKRKTPLDDAAQEVSLSVGKHKDRHIPVEFFPTGCTVLNLKFSGNLDVGWPRGRIINIVGDGASGKTVLTLEAIFNFLKYVLNFKSKIFPKVENVQAIFQNREGVLDFSLERMYGMDFVNAIEFRHSEHIEDLGSDIIKTIQDMKEGDAIIYAVDSWDVFPSIAEAERLKKSVRDKKPLEGSYGGEKNSYSKYLFGKICSLLRDNGKDFTLFIISQTRDNIGVRFGPKKRRTGGAALDFLTHLVPWLRVVNYVEKTKQGEKIPYAVECEAKVKRSKVYKSPRQGKFRILYDYGIDDIGSMYTYLKDHKKTRWKGFDLKDPHKFFRYIEKNNYEEKLRQTVYKIWKRVEDSFEKETSERKQKRL